MSGQNPYARSAFRLIDLPAGADGAAIEERVRQLREAARRGPAGRPSLDLGWLPEARPDLPSLEEAASRLEDEAERLRERVFWFHSLSALDENALDLLRRGELEQAEAAWREAARGGAGMRLSAHHNLAVLYHSRALAAPRGAGLAGRDLEQALHWWGYVLEEGRLAHLVFDGEPGGYDRRSLQAHLVEDLRAQVYALLREGARPEEEGVAPGTPGLRRAALEEAGEAARRGDRRGLEEAIGRARDFCQGLRDLEEVEEVRRDLLRKLVSRGLKPVPVPPPVVSVAGLGTQFIRVSEIDPESRSYVATLAFTVAHLPLFPLGRYRVAERDDEGYEFLGRLPWDAPTLFHQVVAAALGIGVMVAVFQVSHFTAEDLRRLLPPSVYAVAEPIPRDLSPADLGRLSHRMAERWREIQAVSARVAELEAERRELEARIREQERGLAEVVARREQAGDSPALRVLRQDRRRRLEESRRRLAQVAGQLEETRRRLEELRARQAHDRQTFEANR